MITVRKVIELCEKYTMTFDGLHESCSSWRKAEEITYLDYTFLDFFDTHVVMYEATDDEFNIHREMDLTIDEIKDDYLDCKISITPKTLEKKISNFIKCVKAIKTKKRIDRLNEDF